MIRTFFVATLLVGAQAVSKAKIREKRCVICDYVVRSLQDMLSKDILAGKKVKVGWRLNVKGKRVGRTVAYGASETGFIEYLEEICSMDTLRWVFEYKKDGNIKLQDDGVQDFEHKKFKHVLGHDKEKARSYQNTCDWFLDKYEKQLDEHVRKWPRQIVKTEKDGKLVDVFMGRHGGTSSIVYYMCALQGKDLCKPTRWAAEQVSHFSDNAIKYEQHRKQIEDSERSRRAQKLKQKKKSTAPPSSTTTTSTTTTTATSTKTGEESGEVDSDASAGGAAGQGETQGRGAQSVEEVDVHESVVLDPGATVTSTQEKKTEL